MRKSVKSAGTILPFSCCPLVFSDTPPHKKWAHSEGHLHTENTFTGTLLNVGDLRRNSGECQGAYPEYDVVGSPNFAMLHQSSREGARMLLVYPDLPEKSPILFKKSRRFGSWACTEEFRFVVFFG